MILDERWVPIKGYESSYEVSNLGRIKSNVRHGTIKKQTKVHNGYLTVTLHKNGTAKRIKVHRLVAQAFIPNPDGLATVNHKDENKSNNKVENLEWMSQHDNNNHGTRNARIQSTTGHSVVGTNIHDGSKIYFPSVQSANMNFTKSRGSGNVGKCVRGEIPSAYGYRWQYQ